MFLVIIFIVLLFLFILLIAAKPRYIRISRKLKNYQSEYKYIIISSIDLLIINILNQIEKDSISVMFAKSFYLVYVVLIVINAIFVAF